MVVLFSSLTIITWKWTQAASNAQREADAKIVAINAQHKAEMALTNNRLLQRRLQEQSSLALFELGLQQSRGENPGRGLHLMAQGLKAAENSRSTDLAQVIKKNLKAWCGEYFRPLISPQHKDWILDVGFSLDSRIAVTASRDKTVLLWDCQNEKPFGKPLVHLYPVHTFCFTPDGKTLITGSGSEDNTCGEIRFWDWQKGTLLGKPIVTARIIHSLELSQDGKTLLAFSKIGRKFVLSDLGQAQLWDLSTRRSLGEPFPNEQGIFQAIFGPGGKEIFTAGPSGIHRWIPRSGEPARQAFWNTRPQEGDPILSTPISLKLSPDEKSLLTGQVIIPLQPGDSMHGDIRLWSLSSGKTAFPPLSIKGIPKALAFSRAGKKFAVGTARMDVDAFNKRIVEGDAYLWSTSTGLPLCPAISHQKPVWDLNFSEDSQLLLTGGEDGHIRFWRCSGEEAGPSVHQLGTIGSLAVSPNGQYCIGGHLTAGALAHIVKLPAFAGREIVLPINTTIRAVGLNSTGTNAMTMDDSGHLQQWDVQTGLPVGKAMKCTEKVDWEWVPWGPRLALATRKDLCLTGVGHLNGRLWDLKQGTQIGPMLRHDLQICAVNFLSSDQQAITIDTGGVIKIWEIATGKLCHSWNVNFDVFSVSISPNGNWLAVGGKHGKIEVLHLQTKEKLPFKYRSCGNCTALTFTPDSSDLYVTGEQKIVQIWDIKTGKRHPRDLILPAIVNSIVIDSDKKIVVLGCEDGKIRLYSTSLRYPIGSALTHSGRIRSVQISPNGRELFSCATDNIIRIWPIPEDGNQSSRAYQKHVERITGQRLDPQGNLERIP